MKKDEEIEKNDTVDIEENKSHNTSVPDEEFEEIDEENAPEATIKKLRQKLKASEAQKMEYLAGWQRNKADYINLKKESEQDKRSLIQFAESSLIEELLPVISHFENAMSNKTLWESVSKEWRVGIEYIYREFLQVLERRGLIMIKAENMTFDPKEHDAVEMIPVDEKSLDHKIISVRENGFKLNDKVIKLARVTVGDFRKD